MDNNEDVFDSKNEIKSNWVKWGKPGDSITGTLVRVFQVADNYAKVPGAKKNVYEIKAINGSFNDIQNKKLTGDVVTIKPGDVYCVDGKSGLEAQMRNVKMGQIIGIKFMEERAAKDPKNFDAKITKVFAPKNNDGSVKMDEEWLKQNEELPPVDFGK